MKTAVTPIRPRTKNRRTGSLGLACARVSATMLLGVLALLVASVSALATTPEAPASAASTLPDARAVELVSTAVNVGEPYSPSAPLIGLASSADQPFQASVDGEAVAYIGDPGVEAGNGYIGSGAGTQWLATRGADGWRTGVITPGSTELGTSYQAFSSDLSTGILETNVEPALASDAPAGCWELYSRASSTATFTSLVTATSTPGSCGRPLFAGSSSDGSDVIFQTEAALTPNAEDATEVPAGRGKHSGGAEKGEACMFGCNLYEATAGHLRLVNVLPGTGGHAVPNASFGGYEEAGNAKTALSNVISTDGSRIFWTDTQSGTLFGHVFVLEDGATEVPVSGEDAAQYWTASPDGRFAYYTEGEQLWRFDTQSNTRQVLEGPGSGVQGVVDINSTGEDGGYVYFVASGVLAKNQNSNKDSAVGGAPNLYLLHGGAASFIAELSPEDDAVAAYSAGAGTDRYGDWVQNPADRTAQVAPDGEHLAFVSTRELTGYDNENPPDGRVSEAFTYAAGTGQVDCASCDTSGESPTVLQGSNESPLPVAAESNVYARRSMSVDGGRLFFDSLQPLVANDTNGLQDVYEWEADGEGSCAGRSVSPVNGGCVYLLSGGKSQDFSFFIDADATGSNVFLTHRGPLGAVEVPSGDNELYDLRVNGGFSSSTIGCTGAGCPTVSVGAPGFAVAPSVSLSGPGNFVPPSTVAKRRKTVAQLRSEKRAKALKACRKDRTKKKRAACEAKARRAYGARGTGSANTKRRAK
jgi:hypothetical protein